MAKGHKTIDRAISHRLRQIAGRIKKEYSAEKVILYGSYAAGTATEDSDVDLFIVAPTKERFFERMATVSRLIRDLRNGLAVSPIVLTPKELKQRKKIGDPFVQVVFSEGILL